MSSATEHQPPASGLRRSIETLRAEFPGLAPASVRLDGAAGTLVPQTVIQAISDALRDSMANTHGAFAASLRSSETEAGARHAAADLLGGVPEGVVLGPNMTTLTFRMAATLAAAWGPGDEVVVTSLDHDANIRPWVLAAERAGATVRWAEFDVETGELPAAAFEPLLTDRTRLVAVTAASNAIGTKPDVAEISRRAHEVGALTYVDGVHATSHGPADVQQLGADFYVCSAYKLFGPHVGILVAAPELLEGLRPAKLAPAPDTVPARFEQGTPAFELLAGVTAAVDWIAGLTEGPGSRRERVLASLAAVEAHLDALLSRALDGLRAIGGVRLLGGARRRTSTISFVIEGVPPNQAARWLAERNVTVWDGDNYAFELMRRFGLENSGGAIRASLVLYNTEGDVDRLVEAVAELAAS
jgi:cysteine desulfurase family protein (TIGR01976 family)